MKRIIWVLVPALALLAGCSRPAEQKAEAPAAKGKKKEQASTPLLCDTSVTPPPDSSFPKGFDYPQNAQPWVQQRQGDRTRLHAWCVFAGLNQQAQANGPFVWQGWKTSTQAFPFQYNPWQGKNGEKLGARPSPINARNRANAVAAGNNPINNPAPMYPVNAAVAQKYPGCTEPIPNTKWFQLKDGVHMQSNGDIMVAGVIYNEGAIANILKQNYFNAQTLNAMLPSQPTDPAAAIPQFPSSAIVLKPMFWPVQKGGFTVLPVWDWNANKPGSPTDGQYAGYEMQQFWKNAVAITDNMSQALPASLQYLYGVYDSAGQKQIGPVTYGGSALKAVSINDFYHRQLNDADLKQLSTCDRAILDASAYWAYNRAFQAGDYVALIAMHIMTKEQPDWTFQSAWYHPDASNAQACGRFCSSRPTNLSDTTFQHYMMTSTYGMEQVKGNSNYYAPPTTVGAVWPVAYNPYIELAASHPVTTNCMNCHHRAAWPPLAAFNKPDEGRTSSYLQTNTPNPNALEVFPGNAGVFQGLVTVDSMWAVSDRAGYPAKK